jgi:ornithine carbamoyltransferase
VLDRYVDGIVARLRTHHDLLELAHAAQKPVINALSDRSHPCQILADLMTLEEVAGPLPKQHVAYLGDGNNIATSLIEASALTGFRLTVVSPPGYEPAPDVIGANGGVVTVTNDVGSLDGATAVYTDVWTSMGQEEERQHRRKVFAAYQVDRKLMDSVPGAVFLHCLPAHRGEEVTDEVIDGPGSVVFDQAGNRLYAQMALMTALFGEGVR